MEAELNGDNMKINKKCSYHGWIFSAENEKAVFFDVVLQGGLCLLRLLFPFLFLLLLLLVLFSLFTFLTCLCLSPILRLLCFLSLQKGVKESYKHTRTVETWNWNRNIVYFFIFLGFTWDDRPHVVATWQLECRDDLRSDASLETQRRHNKVGELHPKTRHISRYCRFRFTTWIKWVITIVCELVSGVFTGYSIGLWGSPGRPRNHCSTSIRPVADGPCDHRF